MTSTLSVLGVTTHAADDATLPTPAAHSFVFVRPDPGPPHPFFDDFEAAMRAAAVNLGDTLDVRYAQTDHYRMLDIIQDLTKEVPPPDAVVFMAMRNNGQKAIEILNGANIPGFIVNTGLSTEQYAALGAPRDKKPSWLGEMLPDDVGAGEKLAAALYEQALAAHPSLVTQGANVLAIEANAGDGASILRKQGLEKFAQEHENFKILQIVKGKWEKNTAYELTSHMLNRYDRIDVIWAASDAMALGAAQAVTEKGLVIGRDVFIGGVDASQEGFEAMEKGQMNVTVGGHNLEGAWAAIMLHDYFNGYDFADSEGLRMSSPMYVATMDNLSEIRSKMGARNWSKIDFRAFSKYYHPEIKRYDFTLLDTAPPSRDIAE